MRDKSIDIEISQMIGLFFLLFIGASLLIVCNTANSLWQNIGISAVCTVVGMAIAVFAVDNLIAKRRKSQYSAATNNLNTRLHQGITRCFSRIVPEIFKGELLYCYHGEYSSTINRISGIETEELYLAIRDRYLTLSVDRDDLGSEMAKSSDAVKALLNVISYVVSRYIIILEPELLSLLLKIEEGYAAMQAFTNTEGENIGIEAKAYALQLFDEIKLVSSLQDFLEQQATSILTNGQFNATIDSRVKKLEKLIAYDRRVS